MQKEKKKYRSIKGHEGSNAILQAACGGTTKEKKACASPFVIQRRQKNTELFSSRKMAKKTPSCKVKSGIIAYEFA